MAKSELKIWVIEALAELGGSGRLVAVAEKIWENHEADLKASGDLFYTWQYDMRWAAQDLRNEGKLQKAGATRDWVLAK